jgi:hypothetical protein
VGDEIAEGDVIRVRLMFFHVVPGWTHEIRIVRIDDEARRIETDEHGGGVKTWRHRISIDPHGAGRAYYTDRIEIDAGPITPLIWGYAQLFYRYRHWRWRRLARAVA